MALKRFCNRKNCNKEIPMNQPFFSVELEFNRPAESTSYGELQSRDYENYRTMQTISGKWAKEDIPREMTDICKSCAEDIARCIAEKEADAQPGPEE